MTNELIHSFRMMRFFVQTSNCHPTHNVAGHCMYHPDDLKSIRSTTCDCNAGGKIYICFKYVRNKLYDAIVLVSAQLPKQLCTHHCLDFTHQVTTFMDSKALSSASLCALYRIFSPSIIVLTCCKSGMCDF